MMYIGLESKRSYILIWNFGHIAQLYLHVMLKAGMPVSDAVFERDLGHVQPSPHAPNHIRQARFIPPIQRVKLKGDVIFHLGSVIILAVSGALPPVRWPFRA